MLKISTAFMCLYDVERVLFAVAEFLVHFPGIYDNLSIVELHLLLNSRQLYTTISEAVHQISVSL